jgi:hypothetical protein
MPKRQGPSIPQVPKGPPPGTPANVDRRTGRVSPAVTRARHGAGRKPPKGGK